jgi:hypothetical protein
MLKGHAPVVMEIVQSDPFTAMRQRWLLTLNNFELLLGSDAQLGDTLVRRSRTVGQPCLRPCHLEVWLNSADLRLAARFVPQLNRLAAPLSPGPGRRPITQRQRLSM